MKPRHFALALIVVGASGAIYWMLPSTERRRETSNCQSNLKLIGLAMLQYARDYDEKYPLAVSWQDGIAPYGRQDFRCPTTGNSYAFNRFVSSVTVSQISAMPTIAATSDLALTPTDALWSTPLCYDVSQNQSHNLSDNGSLWPSKPIHWQSEIKGANALFGDGHVKLLVNKPQFLSIAPKSKPDSPPRKRGRTAIQK